MSINVFRGRCKKVFFWLEAHGRMVQQAAICTARIRTLIEYTGIVEGQASTLGQQLVGYKHVRLNNVD